MHRVLKLTGIHNFPLHQDIKHINMDVRVVKTPKGPKVKFIVWHGGRKHVACLRTVKSLIENMIIGVTEGFAYKVRTLLFWPVPCSLQEGRQGATFPLSCLVQADFKHCYFHQMRAVYAHFPINVGFHPLPFIRCALLQPRN